MEITGQAVAQLTLLQKEPRTDPPPSPAYSDDLGPFQPGGSRNQRHHFGSGKSVGEQKHGNHSFLPKLTCPKFYGTNPGICVAKCEDYFNLLSVPVTIWTTVASLHMEDNAEKWMQVYKMKHGLGPWDQL